MRNVNKYQNLNDLQNRFAAGGINRRQFLTGAVALGLSLTAASSLIPGPVQAAPRKGGKFRMGINEGATTDSLDPATTASMYMIVQNHTTRNYLVEIGPENTLVPELAESWESSPDAKTWHFKLRKGVEFHNGKTMDSKDVVDSINYHRNEKSTSAAKALLAAIKGIRADGPDRVLIELDSANSGFPYVLTDYHLNILPGEGDGKVDWRSGTGTGAYVLKEFNAGVRSKLVRNPNYFKNDRANFDEVELILLSDPTARQTALMNGSVDVIDQVDLRVISKVVASRKDISLDNVTSWAHTSIPMHMDVAPFDNADVRMALKLGIDRQDLVNKILQGYGTVGNDHPISPVIEYYADLEQRVYDPDRAKYHLKKAGLSSLDVSLSTSEAAGAGSNDTAVLYSAHAKEAGINIKVVREPTDGYWSNVWLKKPFCMVNWGGRPTADVMFTTAYAEGAPWNESHFSHKRFNKLLLAARGELVSAKRAEIYRDMQQIVKDEGSVVIPMFKNLVYLRNAKVAHGPNLSANWQFDGARAAERWWYS